MAKKESYHQKAGRLGRDLLEDSRAAFSDVTGQIERLNKWSGDADELAKISTELRVQALKIAEETAIEVGKKLEEKDALEKIIQESATLATLFNDATARYVLAQDVEGYYQFSRHIDSDARVAAWRRLPDNELNRIYEDWQRAVRMNMRG